MMQNKDTNKGLQVREGRTELMVPHQDGKITLVHPAYGPNTYFGVHKSISEANLSVPTMAETASLVYAAWQNPEERYSKEIIRLLKDSWLWGFTGNLYVPGDGVYIQDNPKIKDGKVIMEKSKLVEALEKQDKTVRFVPFGFKTGKQTSLELSKNHYVVALVGEQGADKLAQVADKYKNKACVWSFSSIDNEVIRVSALDSDWDGRRLDVDGDGFGGGGDGYAFGVFKKSGEATRTKK
ncbi:MAG: hypothetical protein KKG60_01755 [Nanoarchaeota archaeon]|nr:hypothetical protein [Nanoarchaeota archaeon]